MNKLKGKYKAYALLLLLTLTIATLLVGVSAANAQEIPHKKTYAYIIVAPSTTSVNKPVLLIFGITDYLYQWPDGWTGITVTVERPDGKTETLGPFKTDSTGATGASYTPTLVGTYYFQCHFPAQTYNWTVRTSRAPTLYGPIYYEASDSEKFALTVQQEPLPTYPSFGLPTEFWSRPIDSQIREWTYIAGNWPDTPRNLFAPYNQGPETPHILWAKPLIGGGMGALGGGVAGQVADVPGIDDHGFETGDAYEGLFSSRVILGGVLYFNRYKSNGGTNVEQEVVAVDLRTGEELWVRDWNRTRLSFGQIFYWDSYNVHAVYAYLWANPSTGVYDVYEASTGRWIYRMTNVPSGTRVYGPKGEVLIYTLNLANGWMTLWNSSRVVSNAGSFTPYGTTYNCTWTATAPRQGGYEWNKTIPTGLPGSVWTVIHRDLVLGCQNYGGWQQLGEDPIVLWAISLKEGQEGTLLYNLTWRKPVGDKAVSTGAVSVEDRVFTLRVKEDRQIYGFDLDTGRQIWGPTEPLDIRAIYGEEQYIAYGKLFVIARFAGLVYCYDAKTGNKLWTYQVKDPYGGSEAWQKEFAGDLWAIRVLFITDGKIYLGHSEHSPNNPLPRGAPFICLNVETGEEIFRVDGLLRQTDWGARALIGDSIIASMDSYDQRVYAIGKGPSATTVSAPDTAVPLGSSVVIRGKVVDVSPGTKDSGIAMRFPDGVPAVADECMGDWMLYVYKQFPRPTDVKGVWVKLDAINVYTGEYIDIGGTHTDSAGFYTVMWTPPKEGLYTILATFPGSKSYYPSYAETSIGVTAAPPPPPTPETPEIPTPPDYTPILTGLAVAIIVVAILVVYDIISVRKMRK